LAFATFLVWRLRGLALAALALAALALAALALVVFGRAIECPPPPSLGTYAFFWFSSEVIR